MHENPLLFELQCGDSLIYLYLLLFALKVMQYPYHMVRLARFIYSEKAMGWKFCQIIISYLLVLFQTQETEPIFRASVAVLLSVYLKHV